jgi:hypothetical protein
MGRIHLTIVQKTDLPQKICMHPEFSRFAMLSKFSGIETCSIR